MNFLNKYLTEYTSTIFMNMLLPLERYAEHILEVSDYTVDDIVSVEMDLGNHRMCRMVVCPKYCVINGFGIYNPEYFLGVEELQDKHGFYCGYRIIFEPPEKAVVNLEECGF